MKLNKKTLEEQFIIAGKFDKKEFKKFKKIFDEFSSIHNKKPRMKVSSAKNKGRGLQNKMRDIFRYIFKGMLEDGDIESRQMGGSGTDLVLSPLAKKHIPFDFECKNTESLSIYAVIQQAKANTTKDRIPLIVFKKNGLEMWCALPLDEFMRIKYDVDINAVKDDGVELHFENQEIDLPSLPNQGGTLIRSTPEPKSSKGQMIPLHNQDGTLIESKDLDEVTLQNYKSGRNTLDQLSLGDLKYIENNIT